MAKPVNAAPDMATVVGERLTDSLPPGLAAKLEAAGLDDKDRQAIAQVVMDSQNAVAEGDPLGTVRRDSEGIYYIRVDSGGLHKWRIVDPHNGNSNDFDMQSISHPIVVAAAAEPAEHKDGK